MMGMCCWHRTAGKALTWQRGDNSVLAIMAGLVKIQVKMMCHA